MCINFCMPVVARSHLIGAFVYWTDPIESPKMIKMRRQITSPHFIQRIVSGSVFSSLWRPDLIWLGSSFHGIHSIGSCELMKMWREIELALFIQYVVFEPFLTNLGWPDVIWLGSMFYWTGRMKPSKLIEMWREIMFARCVQHIALSSLFTSLWRSDLIWLGQIFYWTGPRRIIQTDEVVPKNELPAFYSPYRGCVSFYKPLVASYQLTGVDVLSNWPRAEKYLMEAIIYPP